MYEHSSNANIFTAQKCKNTEKTNFVHQKTCGTMAAASGSKKKITNNMTLITNNSSQVYTFSITFDTNKNESLIQAKNRTTKDAFQGIFGVEQLQKIAKERKHSMRGDIYKKKFEIPIFWGGAKKKGFYSRMQSALENKAPQELRAYYWLINKANGDEMVNQGNELDDVSDEGNEMSVGSTKSNKNKSKDKMKDKEATENNNGNGEDIHDGLSVSLSPKKEGKGKSLSQQQQSQLEMKIMLEELSKHDDEPLRWCISLQQLDKKDTEKLQEKLEDVVEVVDNRDRKIKEQLNLIVKQVKLKFDNEKQKRIEMEQRISNCEEAIKKLSKMVKELQVHVQASQEKVSHFLHPVFFTTQECLLFFKKKKCIMVETKSESIADTISQTNQQMHEQIKQLTQRFEVFEKQISDGITESNKKLDDIRPKLARLKTRRDFPSEEAYIEYIGAKIKDWDVQKDGRVLIRVNPEIAEGKAKLFIGYVGEPVKWNNTICKVQWLGLENREPESVLPNSSFFLFLKKRGFIRSLFFSNEGRDH
ncbi:myosin-2 heavy chain, non muscle [Reticulomyxa filosa]|uniref:Myosin-2 heavy chain, non muscle n=1 Tax=Reticulomyxa filosa TaxID=46433 RepID=X6LZT1_RETFI|nr:myosin-2 heavy chain, non muscle [Reticulomyxa filosa]|eukprot:ETO06250.1 myosin-2 heavy chain, non muscle [Reticulomyxa filosa]